MAWYSTVSSPSVAELAGDLRAVPSDPRQQHRIVVELIAEARWVLEKRHDENATAVTSRREPAPRRAGRDRSGGHRVLADRRAEHLRRVIGVSSGRRRLAGIVGGGLGTAEVLADDGTAMALRLALTAPPVVPLPIELVLAMPRPKVLTRVIEMAASFGVARIELTNAWRVDKSYLDSPRLGRCALAYALRFGAEQGATTHIPPLAIARRFMGLIDARWTWPTGDGLVAHPGAHPIEPLPLTWPLDDRDRTRGRLDPARARHVRRARVHAGLDRRTDPARRGGPRRGARPAARAAAPQRLSASNSARMSCFIGSVSTTSS